LASLHGIEIKGAYALLSAEADGQFRWLFLLPQIIKIFCIFYLSSPANTTENIRHIFFEVQEFSNHNLL